MVESELAPVDWEHNPQYENVIRVEAVLETIKRLAADSHKGVSGEAILALYDKVVKSPVALEDLVAIAQPLYESWGIHTGKQRTEMIDSPIGRSIAHTLCSFAKHAQTFQRAEQCDSGCTLIAELPSSICSMKGKLSVTLLQAETHTHVAASTDIPGQMYDWGKSQRCLDQLFIDLGSDFGLPFRPDRRRVA